MSNVKSNNRVLAIDPGFERMGIAILSKKTGKETLLYSSCFITSRAEETPQRLAAIGHRIEEVIKKWKPETLAIETLFFNTNQKTAMRVAEARGIIIYEALRAGLEIYEYTPLQIKTAITGYGRADKKNIIDMLHKLLALSSAKKLDDEYDAIAVGLTHFAHHKTTSFLKER